jgi:hypothetical protein
MKYPVVVAVLVSLTVLLSWAGQSWLGPLLFPPAVALWWARGDGQRALGLVAASGGAGVLVGITMGFGLGAGLVLGMVSTVFALLGLTLGSGFRDQAPYGQVMARVIAVLFAIACGNILLGGEALRANARAWMDLSIQQLAAPANTGQAPSADTVESAEPETVGTTPDTTGEITPGEAPAPASAVNDEIRAVVEERVAWFFEHWNALIFGTMFILAMLTALALVGLTEWAMRRGGVATRPKGDFRAVRMPDELVWLVIAAALLWMLDRNYPMAPVRVVAWNGAIILAGIYWLCGMAILLHTLAALRLPPMLVVLFLAMFFLAGDAQLLLCALGFFDTWADFRGRLDRALAKRRGNGDSDGP